MLHAPHLFDCQSAEPSQAVSCPRRVGSMTAAPKGAARREILGRYGVRAPCQYGSARGSGHGDRKAAPDQLAADLVENLTVAWSGLAGVQAFRDLGGGSKLLGLAE